MRRWQRWAVGLVRGYELLIIVSIFMMGIALLIRPEISKILMYRSAGTLGELVVDQIDDVFDAASQTLQNVDASPHQDCSNDDFNTLRSVSVRSSYVKDIGRLVDGETVCSTVLGVLAKPVKRTNPPVPLNENLSAFWAVPLISDNSSKGVVIVSDRSDLVLDLNAFHVTKRNGLLYDIGLSREQKSPVIGLDSNGLPRLINDNQMMGEPVGQKFCSKRYSLCATVLANQRAREIFWQRSLWLTLGCGLVFGVLLGFISQIIYRRIFSLRSRIRYALVNKEFSIKYQPIVCIKQPQNIVAAEALIRWPQGPVNTDVFISISEKYGIIPYITEFVLCTVLEEMKDVFEKHPNFRVSINVSSPELIDGSLLNALKKYWPKSIPRKHIGFELTERTKAELREILPILELIHGMGHVIYMDDFGTGYSSLSQLQNFPIDYLKVDRSFLPMDIDGEKGSIIPEIIAIARRLGVKLVFEGVETEQQVSMLAQYSDEISCQGWYFGRPENSEAIARMLSLEKLN